MLIGITHTKEFTPVIRQTRVLKVGIGISKGRAISVYIGPTGEWTIRFGVWEEDGGRKKLVMKTVFKSLSRAETEVYYRTNRDKAAISNRPQKIPFFTFTSRMINDRGEEVFEPDFAAIEAHGPVPREVGIVLMGEDPWSSEYAWWSAAEQKCHGNGIDAMRVLSLGNESMAGWKSAKDAKERCFPFSPCWTDGCPQAGNECKPNGNLNFQLANNMRLGVTAYFTTTSIRSCWQIFSGLEEIKSAAARVGSSIVGLPIRMVLSPFRSNHDGKPATQYGVSLELRAEDVETLRRRLIETAWRPVAPQPQRLIAEAPADEGPIEMSASAMAAEFYPEAEDEELTSEPVIAPPAAAATEKKTEALADKLRAKREKPQVAVQMAGINAGPLSDANGLRQQSANKPTVVEMPAEKPTPVQAGPADAPVDLF